MKIRSELTQAIQEEITEEEEPEEQIEDEKEETIIEETYKETDDGIVWRTIRKTTIITPEQTTEKFEVLGEERRAHETAVDDLASRLLQAEDESQPVAKQPGETENVTREETEQEKPKSVAEIVNMFERDQSPSKICSEETVTNDTGYQDLTTLAGKFAEKEILIVEKHQESHISDTVSALEVSSDTETTEESSEPVRVHKMVEIFEKIHSQSSVDEVSTEKRSSLKQEVELFEKIFTEESVTTKPDELSIDDPKGIQQRSDISPVVIESLSPIAKVVDDIKMICEEIQQTTVDAEEAPVEKISELPNDGNLEIHLAVSEEIKEETCAKPLKEKVVKLEEARPDIQEDEITYAETEGDTYFFADEVVVEIKHTSFEDITGGLQKFETADDLRNKDIIKVNDSESKEKEDAFQIQTTAVIYETDASEVPEIEEVAEKIPVIDDYQNAVVSEKKYFEDHERDGSFEFEKEGTEDLKMPKESKDFDLAEITYVQADEVLTSPFEELDDTINNMTSIQEETAAKKKIDGAIYSGKISDQHGIGEEMRELTQAKEVVELDDDASDDWEILDKEEATEYLQEDIIPQKLPSPCIESLYDEHDLTFLEKNRDKPVQIDLTKSEEIHEVSSNDEDTKEIEERSERSEIESPVEFFHEDVSLSIPRKSVQFEDEVQRRSSIEGRSDTSVNIHERPVHADKEVVEEEVNGVKEDKSAYIFSTIEAHERTYGEDFEPVPDQPLIRKDSDDEVQQTYMPVQYDDHSKQREQLEVSKDILVKEEKTDILHEEDRESTSSSEDYKIRKYEFDQEIKEKKIKKFVSLDDNRKEVSKTNGESEMKISVYDKSESESEMKLSIYEKHEDEQLSVYKTSPEEVHTIDVHDLQEISRTEYQIHQEEIVEQERHSPADISKDISDIEFHLYDKDGNEVEATDVMVDVTKMDISTEEIIGITERSVDVAHEKSPSSSTDSMSDEDLVEKPARISVCQESPLDLEESSTTPEGKREDVFEVEIDVPDLEKEKDHLIVASETYDMVHHSVDQSFENVLDEFEIEHHASTVTYKEEHDKSDGVTKVDSFSSGKSEEDEIVCIDDAPSMKGRIESKILTSADEEMEGVPVDFVAGERSDEDIGSEEPGHEEHVEKETFVELVADEIMDDAKDLQMREAEDFQSKDQDILQMDECKESKLVLLIEDTGTSERETSEDVVTEEMFSAKEELVHKADERKNEEKSIEREEILLEKESDRRCVLTDGYNHEIKKEVQDEVDDRRSPTLQSSFDVSSGKVDSIIADSDVSERMTSTLIDSSEFDTSDKDDDLPDESNRIIDNLDKSADLLEFEQIEKTIVKMEKVYHSFSESQILEQLEKTERSIDRLEFTLEEEKETASAIQVSKENISVDVVEHSGDTTPVFEEKRYLRESAFEEEKDLRESGFEEDNLIGDIQETYIDRTEKFLVILDDPNIKKLNITSGDGRVPTETVFPDQIYETETTNQPSTSKECFEPKASGGPSEAVIARDESAETLAQISRKLSRAEVDEFEHEMRRENEELQQILQSETFPFSETDAKSTHDIEIFHEKPDEEVCDRPLSPSSYTLETDTDMEGSRTFETDEFEFDTHDVGKEKEAEGRIATDISHQIFIEQTLEQVRDISPSETSAGERPPSPSEFTLVMSHDQEMLTKALEIDLNLQTEGTNQEYDSIVSGHETVDPDLRKDVDQLDLIVQDESIDRKEYFIKTDDPERIDNGTLGTVEDHSLEQIPQDLQQKALMSKEDTSPSDVALLQTSDHSSENTYSTLSSDLNEEVLPSEPTVCHELPPINAQMEKLIKDDGKFVVSSYENVYDGVPLDPQINRLSLDASELDIGDRFDTKQKDMHLQMQDRTSSYERVYDSPAKPLELEVLSEHKDREDDVVSSSSSEVAQLDDMISDQDNFAEGELKMDKLRSLPQKVKPKRFASIDDDDFAEYDVTEHHELMHGIPEHFAQKAGPIYIDPEHGLDSEEDEILNYPVTNLAEQDLEGEEDEARGDSQSHKLMMKKEIHTKTVLDRDGKEQTFVHEENRVEQDSEPPEELRDSMRQIIDQFMETPVQLDQKQMLEHDV